MAAPPGLAPTSTRWNNVGGTETKVSAALVAEVLSVAAKLGIAMGGNKASRMARAYLATRQEASQSFGSWLIAYADPTGEAAVRNVMRERGR